MAMLCPWHHLGGLLACFNSIEWFMPDETPPSPPPPAPPGIPPLREPGGTVVAERKAARAKPPALYQVVMLNDDYTPMEFVVLCLQRFFRMSMEDATRVMLHVHQKGVGVCGIFSYEVAETKVTQVMDFAQSQQHPLQCTLEKA